MHLNFMKDVMRISWRL